MLVSECQLFPSEAEFLRGMRPVSHSQACAPWAEVVLRNSLEGVSCDDEGLFLRKAFPHLTCDLPVAVTASSIEYVEHGSPAWKVLQTTWGVRTVHDFPNQLFAKHDGEARLIGGSSWERLREDVRNPEFWSCQCAPTAATREWLDQREDPAQRLSWEDVEWILNEGEGETLLIRRDRAARDRAASGARFYFRTGTVVTLPEMMHHGLAQKGTCYDVYALYMDLPVVVRKRYHAGTSRDRKRARTG